MTTENKKIKVPQGDQLWKIAPRPGRPRKFSTPEELYERALEYFMWVDENPWLADEVKVVDKMVEHVDVRKKVPYSLEGLCVYLGVGTAYFRQYESKQKETPDGFSTVLSFIKHTIETQQFEGATNGFFNANIIARKLGLADKQDVTQKVITVEQPEEEDADDDV